MADEKQVEVDVEWPTFDNGDVQVSYSPDTDHDKIFTDFRPATEKHNIRNKKRKPKKKTRQLRLLSESEINGKKQSCFHDRKRCVVIAVLIACVIVIVTICIFLGVYFAVIVNRKTSSDKSHSDSSVDVHTLTTSFPVKSKTPKPSHTTRALSKPTTSASKSSPSTTIKTTTKITTKATTTTTSTTTTTPSTTTTTTSTTTTTPAPTEPPVREFTGSQEDINAVIAAAKKCTEEIIFTTDRLNKKQKCSLYYEMLRCVYVLSTVDQLHVPVDDLGVVIENNENAVFPAWIEIDALSCRENDKLDIRNITVLPLTLDELCSSPDAMMYHGKRSCHMVLLPDVHSGESVENKCRIRWGVIGCISDAMSCQYDAVEDVVDQYSKDLSDLLYTGNQSMCNDVYDTISKSSACSMIIYRYMHPIFSTCSRVLQQGSQIANNLHSMTCTLFETFFECSYSQIPSLTRTEQCQGEKDDLRSVAFDIAVTASLVNSHQFLTNVSSCISTPLVSVDLCESSRQLLTLVDTQCFRKFRFLTENTVCKYLTEYIYQCGPTYLGELNVNCSASQIKDAMLSEVELILTNYGINMTTLADTENCIEPE